MERRPISGYD